MYYAWHNCRVFTLKNNFNDFLELSATQKCDDNTLIFSLLWRRGFLQATLLKKLFR